MQIAGILFDFGGVIVTPQQSEKASTQRDALAQRLGYTHASEMFGRFYAGPEWQKTRVGEMTEAQMWQEILPPLGLTDPWEQERFIAEVFAAERVVPEMGELIQLLYGRFQLAILSNASDTLELRLQDLGLFHYFDPVVNSYRIGAAKPDEQAFKIALERLALPPEQVYFIDDKEGNTAAAEALGMRCHLFKDVFHLREDLERLSIL